MVNDDDDEDGVGRSGEYPSPMPDGRAETPLLSSLLCTPAMEELRGEVELAISSRAPVLITGESGTGKTALAVAMARASGRAPVVRGMLGASDDVNTITSELFGHERGAFSGALSRRTGLVEHADGGTLILDEILNLPMHAQQLLLDFTQFGAYRPLGHGQAEAKRSTAWIIAATNGDLQRAVAEGRFREDLYYRLAGIELRLPTLRERRADIPEIAVRILNRLGDANGSWSLSTGALRLLRSGQRSWAGNIRELAAMLTRGRGRALIDDPTATRVTAQQLDPVADERLAEPVLVPQVDEPLLAPSCQWTRLQTIREELERREAELIEAVLRGQDGVISRAARELGIPRTTLASRLKRLGLDPREVAIAVGD